MVYIASVLRLFKLDSIMFRLLQYDIIQILPYFLILHTSYIFIFLIFLIFPNFPVDCWWEQIMEGCWLPSNWQRLLRTLFKRMCRFREGARWCSERVWEKTRRGYSVGINYLFIWYSFLRYIFSIVLSSRIIVKNNDKLLMYCADII